MQVELDQSLVTVAITTYNSALYIIETLDSIKSQSYSPLELIISDDASTDNTVQLVQSWISDPAITRRFIGINLITVPANTGVAANCNRCMRAAKGKWVKLIAGDDILLNDCIQKNVNYTLSYPGAAVVFSQVKVFNDFFRSTHYIRTTPESYPNNLMEPNYTATDQYRLLLVSDRIHYTPSCFHNRNVIMEVGGFDESIPLVEDYPMWLKLTRAGYRLHYFHEPTVGYRQHGKALNNMKHNSLFKPLYLKSWPLKKKYVLPNLPWDMAWSERFVFFVSFIFQWAGLNRSGRFYKVLYTISTTYINPFHYMVAFKRKILQLGKTNLFYR